MWFPIGVMWLLSSCPLATAQLFLQSALPATASADVAVYGATGAGCVAAIAAKRSGAGEVVLLSQTGHIGGMLTGGLMHTDSANDTVIQGITREFFVRTELQYPGRPTDADYPPGHGPPGWLFESHVGERVLIQMLQEANVTIIRNAVNVGSVVKVGAVVESVTFEGAGAEVAAKVWIDASYEGDLLDRSGASMTWGRESTEQYGEQNAGRQSFQSVGAVVSPYWDAAEDPPRVLPHVRPEIPALLGAEDRWMQPYDFRLCLTNSKGNRFAITQPENYNTSEFELWRRIYAVSPPKNLAQAGLGCLGPIPNTYSDCGVKACKKCDMLGMNHGTDMTNGADGYPNGTTAERKAIWQAHIDFTRGLLWFWASDPAVPAAVRSEMSEYGHCMDEYDADSDPPYWPHQLYVREAKRLVGDWVWTQFRPPDSLLNRSIGLGSYSFDSHVVSRIVDRSNADPSKHTVVKEGRVDVHAEQENKTVGQYACIAQRCILMQDGEGTTDDAACDGACDALAQHEWLAVRALSDLSDGDRTLTVRTRAGKNPTFLKKSEKLAADLPDDQILAVYDGQVMNLTKPAAVFDSTYYFVELPASNFGNVGEATEIELQSGSVTMAPYEMPYDVLLPRRSELSNVLAAVAISASHVRFNAIRMEPTWMIMGQAAGSAAVIAMKNNIAVQDVQVPVLQAVLLEHKQKLVP